ncbi:uncharacterized protein PV06_05949 [Exophiala oligosperma]|uniref:Protein BIG1 n=1 Tax=Exophiala oligosperma TaxID=215243 RepID=A0A0D2DIV7_9EURO|nr:uncharacterized protein PV06_05949 [Exophiala oligosperma]KIW42390.1 hypothetical protein PV06_05949 [Exophiala oligosperma]
MRLLRLSALVLAAGSAHAYLDTTPFFMFSTSELLNPDSRLQSASSVVSNVAISLSTCPSDYYVVVSQSGVSSHDYESIKNTPVLAQALSRQSARGVRSSMVVPDVTGSIDSSSWIDLLRSKCGVQVTEIDASKGAIPATISPAPRLLKITLPKPSSQRQSDLAQNDAFFASVLDMLPIQNYTVLYTTARSGLVEEVEPKEYDMESQIQESLHIDLKRDLGLDARAGSGTKSNQTMIDGPLFDKYQFFTPGIFMGLLVSFLLLSILYVGISALASLQVTYAAFDKEMGQLAAKKQQ